jgi:hypothetical protein
MFIWDVYLGHLFGMFFWGRLFGTFNDVGLLFGTFSDVGCLVTWNV